MKTRELSYPIRGRVLALCGEGDKLTIATVHSEGRPTPLLRLDLSKADFHSLNLPFVLNAFCAAPNQRFYAADAGGQIYAIEGDKVTALVKAAGPVLSLKAHGDEVLALQANGIEIFDAKGKPQQQLSFEKATAFDLSPTGQWLAVGFEDGRIQAFNREEQAEFAAGESVAVHASAVSHLLFDGQELQVISAGTDKKLMMTQLRGRPEVSERSAKGHDGHITCLMPGFENSFFSSGSDGQVKLWAGGNTRRAPSSTDFKSEIATLGCWQTSTGWRLAVAGKSSITLLPLDEKGKPGEASDRIQLLAGWSKRELGSEDSRIRESALKTLAEFSDKFTLETLAATALNDSDARLRGLAAEALFRLEHADSDETIASLLAGQDTAVGLAAFARLLDRGKLDPLDVTRRALAVCQPLQAQPQAHQSMDLGRFAALNNKKTAPQFQLGLGLAAIQALAERAGDDQLALDALIEVLGHQVKDLRVAAFVALGEHYQQDMMQAVLIGLSVATADIRYAALRLGYAYGLLATREFVRLIRRHLNDADASVRQLAFLLALLTRPELTSVLRARDEDLQRRLHEIDGQPAPKQPAKPEALDESQRAPLVEAMATPALDICLAGARALAQLHDQRAFGVLLQLSREENEAIRISVAQAFADLGDINAVPRLRLLLHDGKLNVADAAFSALARLLPNDQLQLIEVGLNAPDSKIRLRAISVLAKVLKQAKTQPAALVQLEKALQDREPAVRREAFKTLLNAGLFSERAETLRFALRSSHADLRREVLRELESEKHQAWAEALLPEMLEDPDTELRADVFADLKPQLRDHQAVLIQALHSRYEDIREEALTLLCLAKKITPAEIELIAERLEDSSPRLRSSARWALRSLDAAGTPHLIRVLGSDYIDVRAGAGGILAAQGNSAALQPLIEVITLPEPKLAEEIMAWRESVSAALGALGELGDPAAFAPIHDMLRAHEEAKSMMIPHAANALPFVAREEHREALIGLSKHHSRDIRYAVGLALAKLGDDRLASVVFHDKSVKSLAAAWMLHRQTPEYLYAFLDSRDQQLRLKALSLCLIHELGQRPARPADCLAALAAAELETRLQAAQALEHYASRERYLTAITEELNDWHEALWKLPTSTVESITALLTQAPGPVQTVVLEGYLRLLFCPEQEGFDEWWASMCTRFAAELPAALAALPRQDIGAEAELLPLAVGTYVGILRLEDSAARPADRQIALRRLAGIAQRVPAQAEAVATCLKVALFDVSGPVRDEAFEKLRGLVSATELAAEALASEHRDIARKALDLLLEQGEAHATAELLRDLQQSYTNGIELEAQELLIKRDGGIQANASALTARSQTLRQQAVLALYSLMLKNEAARPELHKALDASYADVRQRAALLLAGSRDMAALPRLSEMLRSSDMQLASQAIQGLENLENPAGAAPMLELLERQPKHSLATKLLKAIAELGDEAAGRRTLALLRQPGLRQAVYSAVLTISGYNQRFRFEEHVPVLEPSDSILHELHPLHPELLAALLQNLTDLGEQVLLQWLIPFTVYCQLPAIDQTLEALSKFKENGVREAAVSALSLRLKEYGAATRRDALRAALGHPEADTKFLAAEGLALAGFDEGLQVLLTAIDLLANVEYRQRAVLALGQLAHPRALDQLLLLAESEAHALQEQALEAIGHMHATEQGPAIFELLQKFLGASHGGGLRQRVLNGLRWFNSPASWELIRQQSHVQNWDVQPTAVKLLAHDPDQAEARASLGKLIRVQDDYWLLPAIAETLREVYADDPREADYLLLLAPNQYRIDYAAPGYLERICRTGEASRLLSLLPEVANQEVFEAVSAALLSRTAIPVDQLLPWLLPDKLSGLNEGSRKAWADPARRAQLQDLMLQLLGRAGHRLQPKPFEAFAGETWQAWQKAWAEENRADYSEFEKSTALGQLLERVLWYSGFSGLEPTLLTDALNTDSPETLPLRKAALQALDSRLRRGEKLGSGWPNRLLALATQGEAELRPLATSLLLAAAPKALPAEQLLETPQALVPQARGAELLKSPELLAQAANTGQAMQEFTAADLPALLKQLKQLTPIKTKAGKTPEFKKDAKLESSEDKTARALLEVLGQLAAQADDTRADEGDQAMAGLKAYATAEGLHPELRKLATRLLRHAEHQRKKRSKQSQSHEWLEVLG